MNRIVAAFVALSWAAPHADVQREAIERAISRVKPALVQIYVVSADYSEGRQVKNQGAGSGVIISEDGYLVSNHHVAGRAVRLMCVMSDNEEIEAELVGTDALSDISVLKLKPAQPRVFPKAVFGDSDALRVGDPVLAMGSPMALSQSVTLGIISNTKMVLPRLFGPFVRFRLEGEDVGSIVRWIAHDAAIYGGNSGGPLVNLNGEVVGVNEISLGLSGAIPGNLAREVAEALIRDGRVRRAWIGLDAQPLLKYGDRTEGLLVAGVLDGSPAQQAGLQSGDILLSVNGQPVTARFQEEIPLFNRLIAALPIGDPVDVEYERDGVRKSASVRTEERPESRPKEREIKALGVTVRDISYIMQKEMKLASRDGVIVSSVRSGGPAGEAKPSIQVRDVITALGGVSVSNTADLIARVDALTRDAAEPVPAVLNFSRRSADLITVVKVGVRELEDPGLEVKKAWLPAATQVITRDLADQIGKPDLGGVRVTQVYPDRSAARAGLQVGDLIVALDGAPLPVYHLEDYEVLPALIRQYRVGDSPEFTILRGDDEIKMRIALERSPKLEREMKSYRDDRFEFTARETTYFDLVRENWKADEQGVLVTEVVPGGWAALGPIITEDLVLAVDGEPVPDVEALKSALKRVSETKPKSVVFSILRGVRRLYVELEPDWSTN